MGIFRKRDKKPAPAWMKWMLVLFVLYAIVANQNKDSRSYKAISQATDELHPKNLLNYDDFTKAVFPTPHNNYLFKELAAGTGDPVNCAQEVSIAYSTALEDGTALADGASTNTPLTFRIGTGKVMPIFEKGIIGMRKGGKRSLLAGPVMAYGAEGFAKEGMPIDKKIKFDIELLDIRPVLPAPADTPYRIENLGIGNGATIHCGESVKAAITVWDISGKRLYPTGQDKPSEEVSFVFGRAEVFMGLEQGITGMSPGAKRLLIVPPAFQKPMHGDVTGLHIPFPNQQTVLVDVELLP